MTKTWAEQFPRGTKWARHVGCGTTYPVDDFDDLLDSRAGKLCCQSCEQNELGSGYGFVAAKAPKVDERTGGQSWQPVPCWLLRGDGPELDPLEFTLLLRLWGYQGAHRSAKPHIDTLADGVGRGERQVQRVLERLVERGLVERWRPSPRGGYRYDVSAFVAGARSAASTPSTPPPGLAIEPPPHDEREPCDPVHDPGDADDVAAAPTPDTSVASHPTPMSPLTPDMGVASEVEPGEVEPDEVEPPLRGGSGGRPTLSATTPPIVTTPLSPRRRRRPSSSAASRTQR